MEKTPTKQPPPKPKHQPPKNSKTKPRSLQESFPEVVLLPVYHFAYSYDFFLLNNRQLCRVESLGKRGNFLPWQQIGLFGKISYEAACEAANKRGKSQGGTRSLQLKGRVLSRWSRCGEEGLRNEKDNYPGEQRGTGKISGKTESKWWPALKRQGELCIFLLHPMKFLWDSLF